MDEGIPDRYGQNRLKVGVAIIRIVILKLEMTPERTAEWKALKEGNQQKRKAKNEKQAAAEKEKNENNVFTEKMDIEG